MACLLSLLFCYQYRNFIFAYFIFIYNGGSNTEQVWYLDGP